MHQKCTCWGIFNGAFQGHQGNRLPCLRNRPVDSSFVAQQAVHSRRDRFWCNRPTSQRLSACQRAPIVAQTTLVIPIVVVALTPHTCAWWVHVLHSPLFSLPGPGAGLSGPLNGLTGRVCIPIAVFTNTWEEISVWWDRFYFRMVSTLYVIVCVCVWMSAPCSMYCVLEAVMARATEQEPLTMKVENKLSPRLDAKNLIAPKWTQQTNIKQNRLV